MQSTRLATHYVKYSADRNKKMLAGWHAAQQDGRLARSGQCSASDPVTPCLRAIDSPSAASALQTICLGLARRAGGRRGYL